MDGLVFSQPTHFSYLRSRFSSSPLKRGLKSRFASAIQVKAAYISQILNETASLSLEQADLANSFFYHTQEESDFFLLLVGKDRAGSNSLRRYYDRHMKAILEKRTVVTHQLGKKHNLPEVEQSLYYSSWQFAAVHIALTIAELRTPQRLSQYLQIPEDRIHSILHSLESLKLITKSKEGYEPSKNWVRLSEDSHLRSVFHRNWRQLAIQKFDTMKREDLHFSGVYSLSQKTFLEIREQLLSSIKGEIKKIETSPEEKLAVLNVDFFCF